MFVNILLDVFHNVCTCLKLCIIFHVFILLGQLYWTFLLNQGVSTGRLYLSCYSRDFKLSFIKVDVSIVEAGITTG